MLCGYAIEICGSEWFQSALTATISTTPVSHFVGSVHPSRKRSEGETTTDCRSKVVVGVIGDAGAVRNGDGQTAAHVGIRNSSKRVETFGEVMIRIERLLVEGARAGTAETGCGRAGSADYGSRSAAVDTMPK